MEVKKIAFLIYSMGGGGAERVLSLLLKKFSKEKDLEVHLIMLFDEMVYEIPFNVKITYFRKDKQSSIINFIKMPLYAYKLEKYCKQNKIKTIFSFMEASNFINVLAKIFFNHRAILSERASPTFAFRDGMYGKIHKFLIRLLYLKADAIVSVSKALTNELKTKYGLNKVKHYSIYNPYDIQKIEKLSKENVKKMFDSTYPVILNIGRFDEQKGQNLLIEAFSKLNIQANLLIIGKGKLKNKLLRQIKDLNLEDRVKLLDFQSNPYKYVASSKAFVLSSKYEGFPNVLVEAMICKTKVVSFDCPTGPREILAPDTDIKRVAKGIEKTKYGYLVEPNSVELLSKAMELALKENNIDMVENAYKRACKFSLENIYKEYKKIIMGN